ncbi:VAP [Symbiodinium sp. CCMP2456]|nr:VAP [Symbiodinium sp. CCMP2456]
MGVTSALVFANLGAAYGTAKSGVGIASMGVMRPDMIMKSIIPVVMAGVLGIYGLITAVIINGKMDAANYSAYSGYAHLGAGSWQMCRFRVQAWVSVLACPVHASGFVFCVWKLGFLVVGHGLSAVILE